MSPEETSNCPFCGSLDRRFVYRVNGFSVLQCQNCLTHGIDCLPDEETIDRYYSEFSFQTRKDRLAHIATPETERWIRSLLPKSSLNRMLDVGGGGGFYAKSFELFRLGKSSYIDLDHGACEFARLEMNLEDVRCERISAIRTEFADQEFEFIYIRHVIEHLRDPVQTLRDCASLLSRDGVLVVQCPNGRSKEGLLYPAYWMKFVRLITGPKHRNLFRAFCLSLSGRFGWGLDPIRHLWAISPVGVSAVFAGTEFVVDVKTASMADPVYSPYWKPRSVLGKIAGLVGFQINRWMDSGLHLVAEIRRA